MKHCNSCNTVKSLEEFYTSKATKSGYMYKCKSCSKEAKKQWAAKNSKKVKVYNKKYSCKKSRKEYMKKYMTKHQQENKAYWNTRNSKHRAAKLQRTPEWLTVDHLWMIEEVYELAQIRTEATGVSHHVDHIIPLKGKLVSGLHVADNLQVLTAAENLSKNNRYEVI